MNERLRNALIQRRLDVTDIAESCGVDPKTASRWIAGRLPHRRNRWAVAQLLKVDESYLWPRTAPISSAAQSWEVQIYRNRASVPREVWISLLQGAARNIDILVFSGTFLTQMNPEMPRMLQERAEAGVRVRLCFGDPSGESVHARGREEGIGSALAAKVTATLSYYRVLVGHSRCEIRLHNTTLYTSMFRYDDHLLVNPHLWGQPASANPVINLNRGTRAELWERYRDNFDAVWWTARPWTPDTEEYQ